MTFEEIEKAAYTGEPLPDYAPLPDQYCYWTMRSLYFCYQNGRVDVEKAASQKNQIQTVFEQAQDRYSDEMKWRKWLDGLRVSLGGMCKEIEANGCGLCKKVMRLLDGRISVDDACGTHTVSPYGFGEVDK